MSGYSSTIIHPKVKLKVKEHHASDLPKAKMNHVVGLPKAKMNHVCKAKAKLNNVVELPDPTKENGFKHGIKSQYLRQLDLSNSKMCMRLKIK